MEGLGIIFITALIVWFIIQLWAAERSNAKYWKNEYEKMKNENFILKRELLNKESNCSNDSISSN